MEAQNLKFFIVDDDRMFLHFLGKELEKIGVTDVHTFRFGIDCINQIEEEPNIVLLDYNLNFMNGGEVLNKILRHNPNICVIVISNQNDISVAVDIIEQGAFDYLVKDEFLSKKLSASVIKYIAMDSLLKKQRKNFFSRLFKRF